MPPRRATTILAELAVGGVLAARRWHLGHRATARAIWAGTLVDAAAAAGRLGVPGAGLASATARAHPALRAPITGALALLYRRRLVALAGQLAAASLAIRLSSRRRLPGTAPGSIVVVNAHAGSARLTRGALVHLHRLDPTARVIVAPRDALAAALDAAVRQRPPTIVAAGGDGTVGAAAHAAATAKLPLGIVPTGTGNDTARGLRIPLYPQDAMEIALRGTPATLDLGRAGDRLFLHAVSVGVVASFAAQVKDLRGRLRPLLYPLAAWRVWRHYQGVNLAIRVDGDELVVPRPLMELAIVNTPRLGGRIGISLPTELASDGRLTAIAIGRSPLLQLLTELVGLLRAHPRTPRGALLARSARSVTIESASPISVAIDGEPVATTPLAVRTEPAALEVRLARAPKEH